MADIEPPEVVLPEPELPPGASATALYYRG